MKFRYIPTICLVAEVGLSSLLNRFHPYTAFPPYSTLCTGQRAVTLRQNFVTTIRFGRQIKVQLLRICSSVLLNLFSLISHCEPRIFALLERKSEEATIAGYPIEFALYGYQPISFFVTYCSSLLGLRCIIFFLTSLIIFSFLRSSSLTY